MYVSFKGYHINIDHAKEIKSLQELKKDNRFFHQHSGNERDELCEEFYTTHVNHNAVNTQQKIVAEQPKKLDDGTRQSEQPDTED